MIEHTERSSLHPPMNIHVAWGPAAPAGAVGGKQSHSRPWSHFGLTLFVPWQVVHQAVQPQLLCCQRTFILPCPKSETLPPLSHVFCTPLRGGLVATALPPRAWPLEQRWMCLKCQDEVLEPLLGSKERVPLGQVALLSGVEWWVSRVDPHWQLLVPTESRNTAQTHQLPVGWVQFAPCRLCGFSW